MLLLLLKCFLTYLFFLFIWFIIIFSQKVVNVQIPLKYPKEFDEGLWGGEGVIQGFKKRHPKVRRFSHFWVPTLYKRVVYSEILDKRYEVTCTLRFLELVDKHYGFDNYILEVSYILEVLLEVRYVFVESLAPCTEAPIHKNIGIKERIFLRFVSFK